MHVLRFSTCVLLLAALTGTAGILGMGARHKTSPDQAIVPSKPARGSEPVRFCHTVTCQWDNGLAPLAARTLRTGKKASYVTSAPGAPKYSAWYTISPQTTEGENQIILFSADERNAVQVCDSAVKMAAGQRVSAPIASTRNFTKEKTTITACRKKEAKVPEAPCYHYNGTCAWDQKKMTREQKEAVIEALVEAGRRVFVPADRAGRNSLECALTKPGSSGQESIDLDCYASFTPRKKPAEICQLALQLAPYPVGTQLTALPSVTQKIPPAHTATIRTRAAHATDCA